MCCYLKKCLELWIYDKAFSMDFLKFILLTLWEKLMWEKVCCNVSDHGLSRTLNVNINGGKKIN